MADCTRGSATQALAFPPFPFPFGEPEGRFLLRGGGGGSRHLLFTQASSAFRTQIYSNYLEKLATRQLRQAERSSGFTPGRERVSLSLGALGEGREGLDGQSHLVGEAKVGCAWADSGPSSTRGPSAGFRKEPALARPPGIT